MLVRDLGIDDSDEESNECFVCLAHDKADKVLPPAMLECPHCGFQHSINTLYLDESQELIVGETNGYDPGEAIERQHVYRCGMCYGHSIIQLRPIIYNVNHDIYYTGRDHYLPVNAHSDQLAKSIKESIQGKVEDYTERIRAGEEALQPWNLVLWIQRGIEEVVVKFIEKPHKEGRL